MENINGVGDDSKLHQRAPAEHEFFDSPRIDDNQQQQRSVKCCQQTVPKTDKQRISERFPDEEQSEYPHAEQQKCQENLFPMRLKASPNNFGTHEYCNEHAEAESISATRQEYIRSERSAAKPQHHNPNHRRGDDGETHQAQNSFDAQLAYGQRQQQIELLFDGQRPSNSQPQRPDPTVKGHRNILNK